MVRLVDRLRGHLSFIPDDDKDPHRANCEPSATVWG